MVGLHGRSLSPRLREVFHQLRGKPSFGDARKSSLRTEEFRKQNQCEEEPK